MSSSPLYIGLMSGTSLDAIDATLVSFSGMPVALVAKPAASKPPSHRLLASHTLPIPPELRRRLHKFNATEETSLSELAACAKDMAELAAQAVSELLARSGTKPAAIRAIAFAGQTIGHKPAAGWTRAAGDANLLAERTGIPVVTDFRQRDIVAGGQGAPLACHFHQNFFASAQEARAILNLGGIANITLLQADKPPLGFDTGPANCLLDEWASKHSGKPFDAGGKWAAQGELLEELLTNFLEDTYFSTPPPKTTGRDYFSRAWLEEHLARLGELPRAVDVQATLLELTALSISLAITAYFDLDDDDKLSIYVAGGGAANTQLLARLKHLVRFPVEPIVTLGVEEKHLEAIAFAWLAYLRMEGIPCDLTSLTGSRAPRVLGAVYI